MVEEDLAPDVLLFSSLGVHKLKPANSLTSEEMLLEFKFVICY